LLQGPDSFGERLDPGVVVCGAPDQPERQRRQAPDGNQSNVVAAEHRYSSRRRVNDPAAGHQGHQFMNAAHRLGAADGPAGWRTRRDDGVIQSRRERRRHQARLRGGGRIEAFTVGDHFGPDLAYLIGLVAAGELDPQVGWRGPWQKAADAAAALMAHKVRGKAVLEVSS
jgi:hypothetical protein